MSLFFSSRLSFSVLLISLFLTVVSLQSPAIAQSMGFRQAVSIAASAESELGRFYQGRDYRPLWTGQDAASLARRQALVSALEEAGIHGLPSARYNLAGLLAQMKDARSQRDMGAIEVALSRAYIAYTRDVQKGVIIPSKVDDGIKREIHYKDPVAYLEEIATRNPVEVFRSLPPQSNEYARLIKEKVRLSKIMDEGGWGPSVPVNSLEPGASGPALMALRDRLMAMGYIGRSTSSHYDPAIQAAVQAFQADHGLDADGVAGTSTIEAINTPVEERLKAVIVAMERERWLERDVSRRHIIVNLTDFSAKIMDNEEITFETRSVVGMNAHDRRSPEFSDEMEFLVVNPTWHVPRSIAVKEYLPLMQRNANAASHLRLYDRNGREVSRGAVNFTAYSARNFPYAIKQPPSSRNALGLVKFMFPNPYNIYLHDTPQKALFEREKRDFSHGCIRLQQPFEFAYTLLAAQENDPQGFFQSVLDKGRETRVDLNVHVPVHILYRTAITQPRGRIQFRADVYGRDTRIWEALEKAGVSLEDLRG